MTAADLAKRQGQPAPAGPIDLDAFKPGVLVLHPDYGIGRIITVEGAGPHRKGRVAFASGPERTFVLALSPLRPVARTAQDQGSQPPRGSRRDGHS
jgi:hypothetical protein